MKGAIIGDIVGSVYEHNNIKTKDFTLFTNESHFTDDSVLTCAIANALINLGGHGLYAISGSPDPIWSYKHHEIFTKHVRTNLIAWGEGYPRAGYGGRFRRWLRSEEYTPYFSCGNGSAMRVSPIGLIARSENEAITLATLSAVPTHNHPDGIDGAVATALCTFAAKTHDKNAVRKVIQQFYPYDFTLDDIRGEYYFGREQALNRGTVPYAVQAFLESDSFEDAIRNAISIGGDSDTLAAITGGIAEAYYGVPDKLWTEAKRYLDLPIEDAVESFYALLEGGEE